MDKKLENYLQETDLTKLLRALSEANLPIDKKGEEFLKKRIIVVLTDKAVNALNQLENSMNANAKASDSLGRKVYYLNGVLTAATIIGLGFSIWNFYKYFF